MFFSKRRIVSILTACAFTCTTAAAIAPSTAHASLLGAIIGTGIQAVQQKKDSGGPPDVGNRSVSWQTAAV